MPMAMMIRKMPATTRPPIAPPLRPRLVIVGDFEGGAGRKQRVSNVLQ
jgi:hypothetical protein